MPLEFAEFAHHYAGSTISEAEQRADFETFADMMECLARYFWRDNPHPNSLGIRFDDDTLALIDQVESNHSIIVTFNRAASDDAVRKKEP